MKRLYLQVYLTVIVSLAMVVLAAGLMWRMAMKASPAENAFAIAGDLATAALPPATAPPAEQQAALEKYAKAITTDLSLFNRERTLIASAGAPLPPPQDWRETGGWMHVPGGHAWSIGLDDGRWLVIRAPRHRPPHHPALGLIGFLGIIAAGVAAGAYPLTRRITRRLERLEAGVVSLGAGELATRVPVEGKDEVARLAENFNRAAERIEALIGAHKMMLANASHELRTPLARIRMGLELIKDNPNAARSAEIERDIAELDELVGEILLASRLDAMQQLETREEVDLLGLAAEEAARYPDCGVTGTSAVIAGDPRLLRRMIRNLLENAHRHGKQPVDVTLSATQNGDIRIDVHDAGEGIAEGKREVIFEPFRRGPTTERGAGLGLALVRQIARRHGGDAVYIAPKDGGSTFAVTLPTRTRA